MGALIPEKIPLISQTENNLPFMIYCRSVVRTVVFSRYSWKLCPTIKLIALKMETCSLHTEDNVYIRMINEERRINK